MNRKACVCCGAPPPGLEDRHLQSIEVKRGAWAGVKPLCDVCAVEVWKAINQMVQSRHTFEVAKNAIIRVEQMMSRRRYMAMSAAVPIACLVYGQSFSA